VTTTIIRKFTLQAKTSHKHTHTYIQTNPYCAFTKNHKPPLLLLLLMTTMIMIINNNTPKSVKTNRKGKVNVSWNQQAQTDRTISNNKPDSIIHDN
jgi:hypothetical protein